MNAITIFNFIINVIILDVPTKQISCDPTKIISKPEKKIYFFINLNFL